MKITRQNKNSVKEYTYTQKYNKTVKHSKNITSIKNAELEQTLSHASFWHIMRHHLSCLRHHRLNVAEMPLSQTPAAQMHAMQFHCHSVSLGAVAVSRIMRSGVLSGLRWSIILYNGLRFILTRHITITVGFYRASAKLSILTRDIDIAVRLSVRPSVRHVPVLDENGLTNCHSFFHHTVAQSF